MPLNSPSPLFFNEFAPDTDPVSPGVITDMRGFIPTEKGVATAEMMMRVSTPLPGTCVGSFAGPLLTTDVTILATVNALFIVQGGVPVPLATGFTNTVNRWRFAPYGQTLIAVNGIDPDQVYQLVPNTVTPLGANAPVAALTAATDYSVILVPPNSQTVFSNLSPTADWTPDSTREVYEENLAFIAGAITSVQRKRSLLAVYRQFALQCATFVGGQIGWDFGQPGTISKTIGTVAHECVVNIGDFDYFIGPDDFWKFDGYNLTRIPNHLKEWFFGSKGVPGDLNKNAVQNTVGHYDIENDLIMWHYPSNSTPRGQAGMIDSVIGFYMRANPERWFMDRTDVEYPLIATTGTHGLVLPDHALYEDDDTAPFNTVSGRYVTSQDFGDRQWTYQINRVRPGFTTYPVPTVAPTAAKLTPFVQQRQTGVPPVAKASQMVSSDGWFNVLVSGRLIRLKLDVYGPCELAMGTVDIAPTGQI